MMKLSGTKCLLDTNILVFACIMESPNFAKANEFLKTAKEEDIGVVLASQNFLEFSSVMIRHYKKDANIVSSILNGFLTDPGIEVVYPIPNVLQRFVKLLETSPGIFPPDLFLTATAIEYEVDYLITDDRDFEKIKGIKIYNPFI